MEEQRQLSCYSDKATGWTIEESWSHSRQGEKLLSFLNYQNFSGMCPASGLRVTEVLFLRGLWCKKGSRAWCIRLTSTRGSERPDLHLHSTFHAFSPDLNIKHIECRKKHSSLTTAITEICQVSSSTFAACEIL
jgi:hypothetical protein